MVTKARQLSILCLLDESFVIVDSNHFINDFWQRSARTWSVHIRTFLSSFNWRIVATNNQKHLNMLRRQVSSRIWQCWLIHGKTFLNISCGYWCILKRTYCLCVKRSSRCSNVQIGAKNYVRYMQYLLPTGISFLCKTRASFEHTFSATFLVFKESCSNMSLTICTLLVKG